MGRPMHAWFLGLFLWTTIAIGAPSSEYDINSQPERDNCSDRAERPIQYAPDQVIVRLEDPLDAQTALTVPYSRRVAEHAKIINRLQYEFSKHELKCKQAVFGRLHHTLHMYLSDGRDVSLAALNREIRAKSPLRAARRCGTQKGDADLLPVYVFTVRTNEDVPALCAQLTARPDVAYAEPNYLISVNTEPDDQWFAQQWSLSNVG